MRVTIVHVGKHKRHFYNSSKLTVTGSGSSPVGTHCSIVLARLFLCAVSTLITEMHVPSLPVSPDANKLVVSLLPVCYSHKYSSNKAYVKMILITVRVIKSKRNS